VKKPAKPARMTNKQLTQALREGKPAAQKKAGKALAAKRQAKAKTK